MGMFKHKKIAQDYTPEEARAIIAKSNAIQAELSRLRSSQLQVKTREEKLNDILKRARQINARLSSISDIARTLYADASRAGIDYGACKDAQKILTEIKSVAREIGNKGKVLVDFMTL